MINSLINLKFYSYKQDICFDFSFDRIHQIIYYLFLQNNKYFNIIKNQSISRYTKCMMALLIVPTYNNQISLLDKVKFNSLINQMHNYNQIMEGKMFEVDTKKPLTQYESNEAPLGNKIYQMVWPQAAYVTHFIPISRQLKYHCRIWIRRTSEDNLPSSTYYLGVFFQNYQRQGLTVQGRGGIYFIDGDQGSNLKKEQWRFAEFYIGRDLKGRIPEDARFMAICFLINWGQTTAKYQACGGLIKQI